MKSCPSFETLMSFLDGELPAAEAGSIEAHLEACPDCRRVLDSQEMLEKSYRESYSSPPEDAFRLMEKRVMASTPRVARRIHPSIQIAAALILTLAGMRLVAGHEGDLLPGRQAETIVVTAESEAVPGIPPDPVTAADEAGPSTPVESVSSVSGTVTQLEQGIQEYSSQDAFAMEEQARADRGGESGAGGLEGDLTLAFGSVEPGGGGGTAPAGGAAGQSLASVAAGYYGTSGASIDDIVQTACPDVPECLSISEECEEYPLPGSVSTGRICDADGAATESGENDLERSRIESFAPGVDQAVGGVSLGARLASSSPPASFFIVFEADGEPASPDSVFLDESFPGWKDSLRGEMRDTTLVLSIDGFAQLLY